MRTRESRGLRLAGSAAALTGMVALGATSLAAPAGASTRASTAGTTAHAIHITRYFGYTGHFQRFRVPYGVRRIFVRAVGAAGGSTDSASGGHGAIVDALPWVRSGSMLYVAVGGTGSVTAGGYNGGGPGGGTGGAGGGGATDLRTFSGHRLVVAAGGGGAGNTGSCSALGGGAGGNAGVAGTVGGNCNVDTNIGGGGGGGGAATLFAGGTGGAAGAGATPGTAGAAGTRGTGGAGQTGSGTLGYGDSGGGGGGWYGGGGGGSGGSTGYTVNSKDLTTTGAGGGGGGGSSFGRVVGLSYGHAYVVIRYTMPAPLTITTPSHLPRAIVGHYYSVTLRARGGIPPYLWTLASGTLPRGLYLHHDGVLSGTPRVARYSHFTVRVMDMTHRVAYQRFDVAVVGRADLAIRLSHAGYLWYHHTGQYWMKVTNTGTARTTAATRVELALPAGLTARHWSGAYWHCSVRPHFVVCVRRAPIAPHASTTIGVRVYVHAHGGTVLRTIARVRPYDMTPRDNTSVDLALVRG